MIFMTSNLGAAEMGSILRPNLGFAASDVERRRDGNRDEDLNDKITRSRSRSGAAQVHAGVHEPDRCSRPCATST
jgi:hypothetical protein